MQATLSLTLFEEQVLQVLGQAPGATADGECIAYFGRAQCDYHDSWCGPAQCRKRALTWLWGYPKINFALGRLQKKGLVTRVTGDTYYSNCGYTSGIWTLSDQGKLLLGIQ